MQKTPLESIKETTPNQADLCFGIKSYLHEFYENKADESTELQHLIRKR